MQAAHLPAAVEGNGDVFRQWQIRKLPNLTKKRCELAGHIRHISHCMCAACSPVRTQQFQPQDCIDAIAEARSLSSCLHSSCKSCNLATHIMTEKGCAIKGLNTRISSLLS
eukprot:1146856-Pelagomonas_calceolata.AAC.4